MNAEAVKKLKSKEKQLKIAEWLLLIAVILMTAAHIYLYLSTGGLSFEQLFPLLFVFLYLSTRKLRLRVTAEIEKHINAG